MAKKQETALAVVEKLDFVVICAKEDGLKTLIETEAGKARAMVKGLDVNVPADRATMITVAASVRTFKKGIETHAKKCSVYEKAKTLIKGINEGVNFSDDYLKNEAKEIRQPVTDWENAEKERVNDLQERLESLKGFQVIAGDVTIDQLKQWIEDVSAIEIDESWDEFREEAQESKTLSLNSLNFCLKKSEEQAAKDAELKRLRDAETQRIADDKAKEEREASIKKEFEFLHNLCNDVDREDNSKGIINDLIDDLDDLLINEEHFGENFKLAEKLRDSALLRANNSIEKLEAKAREDDAKIEADRQEGIVQQKLAAKKDHYTTIKNSILCAAVPLDTFGNKKSSYQLRVELDALEQMDVADGLEEFAEELNGLKAEKKEVTELIIKNRQEVEAAEKKADEEREERASERRAEQVRETERNRVAEVNRKAEEERKAREADLEHRDQINDEIRDYLAKECGQSSTFEETLHIIVEVLATGQVPHTMVNY